MKKGKASYGKARMHSGRVSSCNNRNGTINYKAKIFFPRIITETANPGCRRTILC